MWLLTLRDLQHRSRRVAQATAATAVLLTLALLVAGIADGFDSRAVDTVERVNAGTWVVPAGSTGPFTSAAAFPADLAAAVPDGTPAAVLRGVAAVDDVTTDVVLVGVAGARGMPDGLARPGVDEVVLSAEAEAAVGDVVRVGDRDLTVVATPDGLTMFAGTPLAFLDLAVAQEIAVEGQDVATVVLAPPGTAAPDGFVALTADDVAADGLRLIEDAVGTIDLVRVLLWLVAAMVIGTFVHLASLERTRDFAVLRAVGARPRGLAVSLAAQAIAIAVLASLVALLLQLVLAPVFPLHVDVQPASLVALPVIAVVVALLASGLTLRRVVHVDPADAFGGP